MNAGSVTNASSVVIHKLSLALILNPIAAGITFLAFLVAIGTHVILGVLGSALAFLAFLVTLVALALDLALFIEAHHRIKNQGGTAKYGSALWLVVAALGLQLIAAMTVCFTRNDSRKKRNNDHIEATPVPVNNGKGGWFAGRRQQNRSPKSTQSNYPLVHDDSAGHTGMHQGMHNGSDLHDGEMHNGEPHMLGQQRDGLGGQQMGEQNLNRQGGNKFWQKKNQKVEAY
ncbi:hypothetical protein P7C70_g6406, partial [Phenoliferia sp. Uapishka_3]